MKVKVNNEACIGCAACASVCPDVFEINDDGLSQVKAAEVPEGKEQEVKDAKDTCPTGAIETE